MTAPYVTEFLLMTPPTAAVCWLLMAGAERFGRAAWLVRAWGVATFALWCVFPLERAFGGEAYSLYLAAMALFQAGIVVAGALAQFSRPPWPRWVLLSVRTVAVVLALVWGFNLVFMLGVLASA